MGVWFPKFAAMYLVWMECVILQCVSQIVIFCSYSRYLLMPCSTLAKKQLRLPNSTSLTYLFQIVWTETIKTKFRTKINCYILIAFPSDSHTSLSFWQSSDPRWPFLRLKSAKLSFSCLNSHFWGKITTNWIFKNSPYII